jgi:hypothetical protein
MENIYCRGWDLRRGGSLLRLEELLKLLVVCKWSVALVSVRLHKLVINGSIDIPLS